jgi:hypothetical protein
LVAVAPNSNREKVVGRRRFNSFEDPLVGWHTVVDLHEDANVGKLGVTKQGARANHIRGRPNVVAGLVL